MTPGVQASAAAAPVTVIATTPAMTVTAGMINGAVSRTITAPTDRLRAILATGRESSVTLAAKNVYKTQGVMGFWASNAANIAQVVPENGITFMMNEFLLHTMSEDAKHPNVLEKFTSGATAGVIALTAIYPLYVIQNRMAAARAGQYGGFADCARRTGFCYTGFGTALVRIVPLKGIMFGGYGVLKDWVKDPITGEISTSKSLACSAVSGGVAHFTTYPLHMAQTVLQQEVEPGQRRYKSFVDVLGHRLTTHGLKGWFSGCSMRLCNRIPAVAIEFAVNERVLDAMKWCRRT
jgi:hypothetical protein